MKLKSIAFILASLLMISIATSCSPNPPSSDSADAPSTTSESATKEGDDAAASSGVLNVLYTQAAEPNEKQFLNSQMFDTFKQETGIDVKVDYIAQSDAVKLIEAEQTSGKITYDILYIDTANMASYTQGGWMEDVTEIKNSLGLTFTDMFNSATQLDGKDYFIPATFDIYLTIANKKALDYLPEGVDVQKPTWDQFAQWAVAIAEGSGSGKTMYPATLEKSQLLYPLAGMGLSYGAAFPDVKNPAFRSAMEAIATMAKGNAFYSDQANYSAAIDPLKNESVWLTFGHMGPIGGAYASAPNKFVLAGPPSGPNGQGSTAGAWCMGIQKGAPHMEEAKQLIEYWMNPENNYNLCSNMGGYMSPIAEVQEQIGSEPGDDVMKIGATTLETAVVAGVPSSEYTDWNSVKLIYGEIFNKILDDKANPDQAYYDAEQAKIDALKK